MNLIGIYGPTVTLQELIKILKISRSSYYIYIDDSKDNPHYKAGFPRPIPGYHRKRFLTSEVESYLASLKEAS